MCLFVKTTINVHQTGIVSFGDNNNHRLIWLVLSTDIIPIIIQTDDHWPPDTSALSESILKIIKDLWLKFLSTGCMKFVKNNNFRLLLFWLVRNVIKKKEFLDSQLQYFDLWYKHFLILGVIFDVSKILEKSKIKLIDHIYFSYQ